jgi:hypothetical protein
MSRTSSTSFLFPASTLGCALRVVACSLLLLSAAIPAEAFGAAPVLNPANGHYYEAVRFQSLSQNFAFAAALQAAAAKTHLGVPGHLVTITSKQEQDFLEGVVRSGLTGPFWMGASDAAVEGEWRWVTGPEAGQLFWKTEGMTPDYFMLGTAFGFESWNRDRNSGKYYEPNDVVEVVGEDFATFEVRSRIMLPNPYHRNTVWNDLPGESSRLFRLQDFVRGYVIEYSIPESGSAIMAVIVGAALLVRRDCTQSP